MGLKESLYRVYRALHQVAIVSEDPVDRLEAKLYLVLWNGCLTILAIALVYSLITMLFILGGLL